MSGAAAAVAVPMSMAVTTAAGEAVGRCRHQKGQGQQAQRDATHRGLLSRDRSHDDRSGLPWPYQWSGVCLASTAAKKSPPPRKAAGSSRRVKRAHWGRYAAKQRGRPSYVQASCLGDVERCTTFLSKYAREAI